MIGKIQAPCDALKSIFNLTIDSVAVYGFIIANDFLQEV